MRCDQYFAANRQVTKTRLYVKGLTPCFKLPAVVPGQLFALHLTLVRGNDPDQPEGLQKVTITR